MQHLISLAVCAAALGLAGAAQAGPSYVSIVQETMLEVPAETAWAKVKGYCQLGAWLKTSCDITSGKDGELGAIRKIGERTEEVIVAVTPFSYAYADVDPQMFYHGAVEVRHVSRTRSKLIYSLFFDQASTPTEQRPADTARRQAMFADVLAGMKGAAEAK
ncbi:MAG TPA: SRPBCC family protein [Phenylobacterium sp.]